MILREEYLNKLIKLKNTRIIKVITGIRRCGKSTLLEMFRNYLLDNGIQKEQIIAINFEDMDYSVLTNYQALYSHLKDRLIPDKMNYIFLDEIQHVSSFQKAVDSLYIKNNVDLYITGSNACMLSGELATLLSGRYIEIQMLPLSFKEYLDFVGSKTDLSRKYNEYLQFSSFPYATSLNKDRNLIRDYLSGLYNTVILKDVVARKKISDVMLLESVIRFLFDNIGNLWSTKKISDTMTSSGRKISTHTVENYISALMDSYIVYQAKRYDVKGRQLLRTQEKYYVVDIGLRYFLLGSKGADVGHILENVIYLELIRRGYEVYVGKVDSMEVDFVALNENGKEYYQVAATVRGQEILTRELIPFNKIMDHYPKYLLTLDDDPPSFHNGIRQMNALDFLLD